MTIKPIYENKKAPCFSQDASGQTGCPALNDIPGFLYAISQKDYHLAFQILKKTNPFSGGCGRFCDHPCELACNRAKFDKSVNIRDLERFVSDYAFQNNITPQKIKNFANKSVAIIGGGPAGLTSAYFLKQHGFKVDVYEKERLMGGMMAQGIPLFRYPTEILEWEVDYIKKLGIDMFPNHPVALDDFKKLNKEYDYVVASTGSHKPRKMGVPGEKSDAVSVGLDFLKKLNLSAEFREKLEHSEVAKTIEMGQSVAVIGGGYTAIDVARCATRLGKKVTVIYRRSESDLNIHPGEVEECIKEGIDFQFYMTPAEIPETRNHDNTVTVKLEKMITGEIGPDGKSSIMPSGEFIENRFHSVVKAIGETPDLSYLPEAYEIKGNHLLIRGNKSPSFIAGDARYGYARDIGMVVRAIGSGRNTASEIVAHSTGKKPIWYKESKIAFYNTIKPRYFKKQPRTINDELKKQDRTGNFNELTLPLSDNEAIFSASRCFYCGICTQCDWCFHYSLGAIAKVDKPWNGQRDERYFKFLNEKSGKQTRESVEACPRNAMGFLNFENIPTGSDAKKQYTTMDKLLATAKRSAASQKSSDKRGKRVQGST